MYPTEVECALRSIPGVAQAFVTNVTADDGTHEVAALVVSSVDLGRLLDAARARLSSFKVPTLWVVVHDAESVPMLASGKVDKSALERILRARGVRANAGVRD
jgi:acyl-CoA synthetase (AMP-forming)/AMP-acid ligase II